jgi:hypothetical protein
MQGHSQTYNSLGNSNYSPPSIQSPRSPHVPGRSSPYTAYPDAPQYGRLQPGVLPAQQPSLHGYSAPRQWPPHTPRS